MAAGVKNEEGSRAPRPDAKKEAVRDGANKSDRNEEVTRRTSEYRKSNLEAANTDGQNQKEEADNAKQPVDNELERYAKQAQKESEIREKERRNEATTTATTKNKDNNAPNEANLQHQKQRQQNDKADITAKNGDRGFKWYDDSWEVCDEKPEEGREPRAQPNKIDNKYTPAREWQRLIICDNNHAAYRQKFITRKIFASIHLRNEENAKGTTPLTSKYPEGGWAIISPSRGAPSKPPNSLKQKIERSDQRAITTEESEEMVRKFITDAQTDLVQGGKCKHRARQKLGVKKHELRVTAAQMTETTRAVLEAGWTLIRDKEGWSILDPSDTSDLNWGFNATRLKTEAERLGWKDLAILHELLYGFDDLSAETPAICCASPHQSQAIKNAQPFEMLIIKEVEAKWYTEPGDMPLTWPFRLVPGSVVPKRQIGIFRLIWNLSWPARRTANSAITNGQTTRPLASNDNTTIPSWMRFEWPTIAANNQTIAILNTLAQRIGAQVVGTTLDFKDWFRQLAASKKDWWKAQVVTREGCRIDKRVQMGRKTSAFHGQRLAYLIAEIIEDAADTEQWATHGLTKERKDQVTEWMRERATLGKRQHRAFRVSPFQDDLTILAVGEHATSHILRRIKEILAQLVIALSPKPEANKPFSTRFDSIGASYNTSDASHIKITPTESIRCKLREVIEEARKNRNKLVDLEVIQQWTGLAQFISSFIKDGRFYLNSAYAAIAGSNHIRTAIPHAMVTTEMVADFERLEKELDAPGQDALQDSHTVWDCGDNNLHVDATAPEVADGRGWGVVMGERFQRGAWPAEVVELINSGHLSINHLEFMALVLGVEMMAELRMFPTGGARVLLRGDNDGVCGIVNRLRADGVVMRHLLRELKHVCDAHDVRPWMEHISGEQNETADKLSRDEKEAQNIERRRNMVRITAETVPAARIKALVDVAKKAPRYIDDHEEGPEPTHLHPTSRHGHAAPGNIIPHQCQGPPGHDDDY